MKARSLAFALILAAPSVSFAQSTIINGLDFGPLAKFAGSWKSDEAGGVDIAPGKTGSLVGKGGVAVEPFYEIRTFEPVADAENASDQYLVAMYYKQEVFRKRDDAKIHDQRGYLIYDKKRNMVYNSYCIPRAVCVVAEGTAGEKMELKAMARGVAESAYMTKNDKTTNFAMTFDITGSTMKYTQTISLHVYGEPFEHVDSGVLYKVAAK